MYLADDLSYADLGFHGNKQVASPTVDEFARASVAFSRMYTPTAMCTPARAVLYSGRYPLDNGAYMNHGEIKPGVWLLPDHLKPLGYKFLLFGKDHVGLQRMLPEAQYWKDEPLQAMSTYMNEFKSSRSLANNASICVAFASSQPHSPHTYNTTFVAKRNKLLGNVKSPRTRAAQMKLAGYFSDIYLMDKGVARHCFKSHVQFLCLIHTHLPLFFNKGRGPLSCNAFVWVHTSLRRMQ